MIRILLNNIGPDGLPARADETLKLVVEGHSGTGRRGDDIVCAGVSAVVQTAVVAISKVAKAQQHITQREGYLESRITYPEDRDPALAVTVILQSMILGLDEIARQYPKHVRVSFDTGKQSL